MVPVWVGLLQGKKMHTVSSRWYAKTIGLNSFQKDCSRVALGVLKTGKAQKQEKYNVSCEQSAPNLLQFGTQAGENLHIDKIDWFLEAEALFIIFAREQSERPE